jgi:23S rRNA pseudouridine1911/1915/1917 synthase
MKRWVVREGDGRTVGDVLARMKEDTSAVRDGRVFLGKKRVTSEAATVKAGDEVRVGARAADAPVTILAQGSDLVAVLKPAGIPTVPDHAGGAHALVTLVGKAIGRSDLRVTSRLDRDVSGVVVFALGDAAEARLKSARERGAYARRYVAIAHARARLPDEGAWDAPIGRGKDALHRAVDGPEAKPSRTRFHVIARTHAPARVGEGEGDFALLAVEPETGRTHQIRVHASHAGAPLLGDRDYGGPSRVTLPGGKIVALTRIALHAARVVVPDAEGNLLDVSAPVPPELVAAWAALGGDANGGTSGEGSVWDAATRG